MRPRIDQTDRDWMWRFFCLIGIHDDIDWKLHRPITWSMRMKPIHRKQSWVMNFGATIDLWIKPFGKSDTYAPLRPAFQWGVPPPPPSLPPFPPPSPSPPLLISPSSSPSPPLLSPSPPLSSSSSSLPPSRHLYLVFPLVKILLTGKMG